MGVYQRAENKELVLEIHYDEMAENPRNWSSLGKMVCFHKRHSLGDDHSFASPREFFLSLASELLDEEAEEKFGESNWEEILEFVEESGKFVILPLYVYSHGGITIRTTPFNCPWDSGQVGWIYASKEDFLKETSHNKEKLFGAENRAEKLLLREVEVYDSYLTGNVYGFKIKRKKICRECNHVDFLKVESEFGFYGNDFKKNGLEDELKPLLKEKFEDLYSQLN